MKKYTILLGFCFSLFFVPQGWAQEFNFTVKVVSPNASSGGQKVDPKVYASLQDALLQLLNTTKWTEDVFDVQERIVGNLQVNIKTENSATNFTAELQFTARRPIFGTDAESPLIVHIDREVTFNYEQFQPLLFAKNVFQDNMIQTIAFYAYSILGMEYDTFSPLGGEPHFQSAQDIVNILPDNFRLEWTGKDQGNRTRSWITENNLSPRMRTMRQAFYDYHRGGLDVASTNVEQTQNVILRALEKLDEANTAYPNALQLRIFCNTKAPEIIEIFKNAKPLVKTKVIQIMTRLDAANAQKYVQIGS